MINVPSSTRILMHARLTPVQGTRFQPTGFPDIGAATYQLADGTEMLLLESAQSIANRLESVCWDEGAGELVPVLAGMPYVRVHEDGKLLTTSIQEAHRLNSVYIENSKVFFDGLKQQIDYNPKRPADLRKLASVLLRLDPNSLVHGTFLESIAGVLRLPRALSGFIEARGVRVVASGGVKNDRVTASSDKEAKKSAAEGFGNVPYHRDEYTAESIDAYFNLDLALLRSYGLGEQALAFLTALALWKVQTFLRDGLRLRTACDLDIVNLSVQKPTDFVLPTKAELDSALPSLINQVAAQGLFVAPPISIAEYQGK